MPPVKMRGVQKPKNAVATIRRLISYMGSFKMLWPVVFLCVALSSLSGILGTYMLKPAINDYIVPFIGNDNPPLKGFLLLIVRLAVIYVCGAFSSYCCQRILIYISTQTLCKIRKDLFAHMQDLPVKYYDSHTHGVLMSLYTNDTDTLRDMFSQSVPQLMTAFFQVSGVFIMMLILSVPLALVMVLTMVFIMIIAARLGKKSALAYRSQQANIAAVNGYIEELIEGQKVVKVFTREKQSGIRFDLLNDKLCKAGTQASTYASILGPIMNNLSHLQYGVVAMTGALLVIYGMMDLGTIASFLQSTRTFSQPLSMVSQQFNSILNALAGAERIFAAIDEESEVDEGSVTLVNAYETSPSQSNDKRSHLVQSFASTGHWAWKVASTGQLKKMQGNVVFTSVDFAYDNGVKVLHDININAKSGQKIALVGSTGSGKTTITSLLTRFYDVDGEDSVITYDGIPIKDIKKDSLRRSLGMVLQDTHLFSGTIRENIRYGNPDASDSQVIAAAKLANADYFISRLKKGYDTVISGDGSALSQGQRQLLAIARAAVSNPPVLILDEATSSIDTRTEHLIEQGMDKLMQGRTTFVIAHRLSTVRNADLILVLENGRIIEQGTHLELLDLKGRYFKLYTGAFLLD